MLIDFLKDMVGELAGADSRAIVDVLYGKSDVNEFLIAKKMDLTINQVRNILYKLSAEGLVSFIRKKDKKKGWYIYFWTLNTEKCLLKTESSLMAKEEELKHSLENREIGRYYRCKGCNIEVSEEIALDHDFTCEECAEPYESVDNSNVIKEIRGKITRKENEIKSVQNEIELLREKNEKKLRLLNRKKELEKKKTPAKKTAKTPAKKTEKKVAKEKKKTPAKKTAKTPAKKTEKKVAKEKKK